MKKPVSINIVGQKNSGKTTLIQLMIKELNDLNIRVGTVKHTSHDHEFDIEGTDSWKHMQAGSNSTVIISPKKLVCHIKEPSEQDAEKLMEMVFRDYDLILWEGDRNTENSVIECIREGNESLFMNDERVIAVVSDTDNREYSNYFSFDAVENLAGWLTRKYQLSDEKHLKTSNPTGLKL